jgi:hypothetical protein
VTVSVVTVIRADQPFDSDAAAEGWLGQLEDSEFTGELLDDAISTLDRARAADAAAGGTPFGTPTAIGSLLAARIGYGDGDQVASGRFLEAWDVDARGGSGSRRRERMARTGSLARMAAIVGGRDEAAACEVLIPRVRLDLNTGNLAAACLAAGPAFTATVAELEFAVDDPGHEQDLDRLEELLPELGAVSERAASGSLDPDDRRKVEAALEVAERVIRRRRILDQ